MISRRTALALSTAALSSAALASTAAAASDPTAGWTVINALGGLGDPNHPDAKGLTPRMLADAHASGRPSSINHTGCRALTDLPRNKTDEELRLVAEKGGFVGIYFMPFLNLSGHATAADVVAHVEHALKVCGEDHVGIGTDGGTTQIDDLEAYKAALTKEHEERVKAGISAPGERADTHPFVDDLRGPGQFRKLARLLAARGHRPATIEKVLGGNFLRYAREIWGA